MADQHRFELLQVEIAGGVATATIDAPPMNLLGAQLVASLDGFGRAMEDDARVRVVVLKSADPDFFIAHGDVETIVTMMAPDEAPAAPPAEAGFVHQAIDRFRTMPKVTIAQIEGFARGGGSEVALGCDMRFAALDKAVVGQPEIGLGILPGAGGTARLVHLLGRARAAEILFGGDDFTAAEAERLGWINRALPPDELGPYVERLARRIASFPGEAIAEIKRVMNDAEAALPRSLALEDHAFQTLMAGEEPRRRMRRFLDRGSQTRAKERTLGADLEALVAPD